MSWIDDINEKVIRKIPQLENDEDLCNDLIRDVFNEIIIYSKANTYEKQWDNILVRGVAMLYNNLGTEGLTERTSVSTKDTFDSVDVISNLIQSNIQQKIRPIGYSYSSTRFDFPD